MIDLELHAHTRCSHDSLSRPADVVRACRRIGLHRIAITDHNRLAGALEARELAPDLVIVGEEVSAQEGHLLCLFLREPIPRGLPAEEVIARAHAQGGLAGAAHPLDLARNGIGRAAAEQLKDRLDFLEVFNARTLDPFVYDLSRALARSLDLPAACGSDAHLLREVGGCRVRMREYASPQDFLAALRGAELITRRSSWLARLGSRFATLAHLVIGD
jgi:predicted metal-dependent phosphoesterase TrpH